MEIPTCLEKVVAVSDVDCPCTESGRPADYQTSKSGLFLDSLIDLNMPLAAHDCEGQTVWQLGQDAIDEATALVMNNLLKCWGTAHVARKPFTALIGEPDFRRVIDPYGAHAGLRIMPRHDIEFGEIVITGISTAFSATGTVDVMLYDSLQEAPLWAVTLDTTANVLQPNPLDPVEVLPFTQVGRDPARYWLVYTVDPANKPLDAKCFCTCNSKQSQLEEWAFIRGVAGNDDSRAGREDWMVGDYNNGLFLHVEIRCDARREVCDEEIRFGYDAEAGVLAEAIWYLGAALLAEKVLNSSRMNYYTAWDNERLVANAARYRQEAGARVTDLCGTKEPKACYYCRDTYRMQRVTF